MLAHQTITFDGLQARRQVQLHGTADLPGKCEVVNVCDLVCDGFLILQDLQV